MVLGGALGLFSSSAAADPTGFIYGFAYANRGSIIVEGTSLGAFTIENHYVSFQRTADQFPVAGRLMGLNSLLLKETGDSLTDTENATPSPIILDIVVPKAINDPDEFTPAILGYDLLTFDRMGSVSVTNTATTSRYLATLYATNSDGVEIPVTLSGLMTFATETAPGSDTFSIVIRGGTDFVLTQRSTGLVLQDVQPIGDGFTLDYNYSADGGQALSGTLEMPSVLTDSAAPGSVVINNSSAPGHGNGTILFLQDQRYTGGTTINETAVLQLGNGGTSGSVIGNIINNGALTFNRADDVIYAGEISGTGSVMKTGAGTLIMTGDNSYTGGTTVNEGTLQIGDGGTTGSVIGTIVNHGALVFNRSGSYDFPGNITGSGSVAFLGGSINFTGETSYAGEIQISHSALELSPGATSDSAFIVADGGTIGGTGTIGGLIVRDGGTATPGYSPGTLTVAGNVVFETGSTYRVDVNADGSHDLITTAGTAIISDSMIEVVAESGYAIPLAQYTILTAADGITGQFASVTSNFAYLAPALSYDANNVYLMLARNNMRFSSLADTANQRAAAEAIEALAPGDPIYDAALRLATVDAPGAFDTVSGEIYATASSVIEQQSTHLREAVGARLRQGLSGGHAPADPATASLAIGHDATAWAKAYGARGHIDSDGNAAHVSHTINGLLTGIDATIGSAYRLGIVAGTARSTFEVHDRAATADVDHYDLGLYAGTQFDAFNVLGGISYGWHAITVNRTIAFGNFGATSSAYHIGTGQVFAEANRRIDLDADALPGAVDAAFLEPYIGLAYINLSSDNLTESGTSAALTGVTETENAFYTTLGIRAAATIDLSNGAALTPRIDLGWQHAYGDASASASLAFASGGPAFVVTGAPIDRDTALIGVGVDYAFNERLTAGIAYNGQFATGIRNNTVKASLEFAL